MFREVGDEEERVARQLVDDRVRGMRFVHDRAAIEAAEAAIEELLGSFEGRRRLARWRAG
jgi:hypothetical protein